MQYVSDWHCVVGLVNIMTETDFSSYSIKRHSYLCFYSSFVFTYLYPPTSPLTSIARLSVTVNKS